MVESFMSLIGISMALASIPQIKKLYRTKSSNDLSIMLWVILIHGQLWWAWYGYYIKSTSILITNVVCVAFSITVITLVLKYKK